MKIYIIGLCLLFSSVAFAQKGIDGMVQSERNFAAYAIANNTKDAFLKFTDSTGVVFEKGQALNATEFWNKKNLGPVILNWRPIFAEIARSEDFGYTTGPWTIHPKTTPDSIIAAGRFFTVWQLNDKGEWHFLLDMGLSKAPIDSTSHLKKIQVATAATNKTDTGYLLKHEADFIALYTQNPKQAYKKYLSKKSILSREQMDYAINPDDQAFLIASFAQPIQLIPVKAGIAPSGELGYIYGQAILNGKTQNYLHIWRNEPQGWKLALELIQH